MRPLTPPASIFLNLCLFLVRSRHPRPLRDISAVMSASGRPERHQRSCGAFITPSIIHCTHPPSRPGTDLGSGSTQQLVWLRPGWLAQRLLWDLSGPAERSLQQKQQHLILQLHSIKGQRLTKDTKCVCVCVCVLQIFLWFQGSSARIIAAFSQFNLTSFFTTKNASQPKLHETNTAILWSSAMCHIRNYRNVHRITWTVLFGNK